MSERILVVDDDDRIAAIVRAGLTRMGYRVELAADGPAALAAVRAQPFDLVVLDLLLRGNDLAPGDARSRAHRPDSPGPSHAPTLGLGQIPPPDRAARRRWGLVG